MTSISKPSAASDTVSAHKLFNAARLKLAAVSTLVVALVVLSFSFYIYQNITSDVTDIGSHTTTIDGDNVQQQFVDQTTASVVNTLMYADIALLLVAAGLSFYFAGRTLRPIQKANDAQRVFATNASHELRTPLAILKSDTEMLLRARQPGQGIVREIVSSNLEEIERMERIVENLLALARSERVDTRALVPVDVGELARNIVVRLKRVANEHDISLAFEGAPTARARGSNDIERAITNLVQNALEHTPSGGSVTLSIHKDGPNVHVVIKDTGVGIPERDLPHVFERFYKGENGGKGSGLGLSLVKEIVERVDGSVSLASELGKGTTATITLHEKT